MTIQGRAEQLVLPHIPLLLLCCAQGLLVASLNEVCNSCHANATCMEKDNKYFCMCNFGLIGNGRAYCIDKDECQIGANKICGNHTACHNTYGSFYCVCLKGYQPSNNNNTFIPNDGTYCIDIDECAVPDICGYHGKCKNVAGSYECYCKEGYRLQKGSEPFQAEGDMSLCIAVDCGLPPALPHSLVDPTSRTTFGSQVTYSCAPGFTKESGDNVSNCTESGKWDRATLQCKAVDCGLPMALPNTVFHLPSSSTFGNNVTFRCANGFVADSGHDTSVCTEEGIWKGTTLTCTAVDCGPPPSLPNTVIHSPKHTTFGNTVTYRCANGFVQHNGQDTAVCTEDGIWKEATLICKAVDCGLPLKLPNTVIHSSSNTTFENNVTYKCATGFILDNGYDTSVCTENGTWDGANLECKAVDCGIPLMLPNTVIHSSSNTTFGNNVTYRCAVGFVVDNGYDTSVCTENGTWDGANLECKAVDCGLPLMLPNTVILSSSNTTFGNNVTYRCATGFVAHYGYDTSICTENGTWEGASLECKVVDCGSAPSILHTFTDEHSKTSYGSVVIYECLHGYVIDSGNKISTCNNQGQWEGADLVCREIDCGQPPSISNTEIIWNGSSNLGSEVYYTCAKGYYNQSNLTVSRCTLSETWENVIFTCTGEIDCGAPSIIDHATMLWNNRSSLGSYAYYLCNPGFQANIEKNFSVCTTESVWEELNLTCTVKENLANVTVINKTCLQWTRHFGTAGKWDVYTLFIEGRTQNSADLLPNIIFNISTDKETPVLCLDLPSAAEYIINVTEASTGLSANVRLKLTENELLSDTTLLNETCLRWNRSVDGNGLVDIYKLHVQVGKSYPKELQRDLLFNISTHHDMFVVCLELPVDMANVTEVPSAQSAFPTAVYGKPIRNLTMLNETCLSWIRESRMIEEYMFVIQGIRCYQKDVTNVTKRVFNFTTHEEFPVVCLDLYPGTNYTVKLLSASKQNWATINVLTRVADPPLPKVIYIATQGQLPRVSFQALEDKQGPISSYQVFVIRLALMCTFTCESLEAVSYFSNKSKAVGYITAEFYPRDVSGHLEFSLGDRQYYGDFYNAPLAREKDYCIILRIVRSWDKMRTHSCMVLAEIKQSPPQQQHMTVVLLGAVAFVGFTVFISYSVTRCSKRS